MIAGKLRVDLDAVDLCAVITRAVEVVAPAATAKGINLATSLPPRVMIRGDADRLQQIVGNLLGNAIKFTDAGGRVDVELRDDAQEDTWALVVRDTGDGI